MSLSLDQWHQRYLQQATWTDNIRRYVYNQVGIFTAENVLDIGCGTGVLEEELSRLSTAVVFGVDIDIRPLRIARKYAPGCIFSSADCSHLPYRADEFDITLCHFLLLWVTDPLSAIKEMIRVTHPKGFVLALAEPDYGGRIDFPAALAQIGVWQSKALEEQGANPSMGRQLRSLFTQAGLDKIEVGVLGGQWGESYSDEDIELEWEVIHSDLDQNIDFYAQSKELKEIDLEARRTHQRILFVPTFYALGMVKG